jgi:hypothetical protein
MTAGGGAVVLLLVLLAGALPAGAQSPNTATIVVSVVDPSGAAIEGASIELANDAIGLSRTADSGEDGRAAFPALPLNGSYTLTVRKAGFAVEDLPGVTLRAGETATLRVRLLVGGAASSVTVYGTTEGVRADPQLGIRLDSRGIADIPVPGRKVSYLPLLNAAFRSGKGTGDLFLNQVYFVSGAGGRREPTFVVDGATGDDPWGRQAMFSTLPMAAIEEMNVLSSAFSSEFGWTSGTAVNVVTRSGSNVLHGEAVYAHRPGAWQARTVSQAGAVLAPADVPDVLHQVSAAAGGPLARDRTFLFAAADYTHQDRTAYFSAAVPAALLGGVTSYDGHYRQALLNARIDHRLGASHRLMGRFNLDRFSDDNPQDVVSGTTLPSAGRDFRRRTASGQANVTSVISGRLFNEGRVEYQRGDPITDFDPISPSTQFTRAGVATEGESRVSHVWSHQTQISDTLSWLAGRHYLRAGGSLARATSGGDGTEFGGAFTLGQFTLDPERKEPVSSLTIADATRYTQTFDLGVHEYESNQWIVALFAQDSLQLGPGLTVDLGLRYDRQTFTDGTKNLAPRVGMGWHPNGSPATVVRGGYGVYYTMLRANIGANFALNGPEGQFSYSAAPGQPGFPSSLTSVPIDFPAGAALPARNITIRPGRASEYARFFDVGRLDGYPDALVNPKSQVTSIGIEREIAPRTFVSADYVHQHWTGLDRTVDLNAPALFVRTAPGQVRSAAAADATRPIVPQPNGFRQINVVENLGVADYDGLQTSLRWRGARGQLSVSYTLSRTTNTTEPNGNGPGPNDFNQLLEEERGPSILDQRHRAVLSGVIRLPYEVTAGTVSQLASARPFNGTTGVDNNGDGNTNDRPVIDGAVVGRTAFRGSALYDTSVFAEKRLGWGERAVLLRVEAFNVFNNANVLGRIGIYGNGPVPNATFGAPSTGLANLDPGRMIQLQARVTF